MEGSVSISPLGLTDVFVCPSTLELTVNQVSVILAFLFQFDINYWWTHMSDVEKC